jgi:RNA polymerase sigma factor (sigma-70 family)
VVIGTARLADVDEDRKRAEFAEFFRGEYPGLVRGLCVLTADMGEAEDLAQEAMARAFERWDRVGLMGSPGGYVYRAAVNLNRKRHRHLAMRARRLVSVDSRVEFPQELEVGGEVFEAIASLSRGQREAFMLVEWFGLSSDEAGPILGIAPASVRSRVHRARTVLRERFHAEEERDG